jgi:tRNA (guanine-N7-)-methyltransferase
MRYRHELIVEPIGLEVRNLPKPIDPSVLFGNDLPLELEIGVGKGAFLAHQAKSRPDAAFLGVERAPRYWRHAADRLRRNECLNVRLVRADAQYFLSEFVPDGCLSAIYIHFPDPWPKKRHHKRRLIQAPFLREVGRALKPGGRLQIVTDHHRYYERIEELVRSSGLITIEYQPPDGAGAGELVGSSFEKKYHREGRLFFALAATKPSSA